LSVGGWGGWGGGREREGGGAAGFALAGREHPPPMRSSLADTGQGGGLGQAHSGRLKKIRTESTMRSWAWQVVFALCQLQACVAGSCSKTTATSGW
jgi:hypothetical protein